jgi:hypothetical protein
MKTLITAALAGFLLLAFNAPVHAEREDRQLKGNTRTSVNKGTQVKRESDTNINVNSNRNTNVNVNSRRRVDVDIDVDRGFHPVATVATVAVTAAVIGSMTPKLPPACVPVQIGNVLYQQCGPNWYQPQYVGTSVQYMVVAAPR